MVLPIVNTVFNLYTRKLYTKKAVSSYDICYYQLRTMSYLNVYFFTRESQAKKGGLIIYCRAAFKGKRKDFSLGKTIPPNLWDKKKAFPNKKLPEGKRYYDHLKTVEKEMYDAELKCIKNSKTYSLERIIDYYQGLDKQFHGIVELFNKHQIQFKQLVAVNQRAHRSYIRYDMCLRHLCNYLKEAYNKTDLDVRFLDYPFIEGLDHYIRTIRRCSNNTTVKYIQCFKKIVRTAIHNRVIDRDPFIEYKGRIVTIERECLNDTELNKLASLELKDENLRIVRDSFLISCYTGLAYADLRALRSDQIIFENGDYWIKTLRQKSKVKAEIILLPKVLELLKHYKNHPWCIEKGRAIYMISNQKTNKHLKTLAKLCGITKVITFHIARHTFATTVTLAKGISIEVVSKMLGHKSIKQTQHYARMVNTRVQDEMQALKALY